MFVFYRETNKIIIKEVDDAYIRTRYFPQYLFPEQVEKMFKFLEELIKLLKSL
ncbi:MAG: HEPN domain-containing protein [Cytophagales bacterium]|nr:HEPN domain-containing protein [Cytophagales bacterium]